MTAPRPRGRRRAFVAIVLALALLGAACSSGDDDKSEGAGEIADPGDCTPVDMAVSSEKIALLTDLADEFNDSDAADLGDGNCAFVRVQVKASGAAMQLLTDGWPEPESNGPATRRVVAGGVVVGRDPQPTLERAGRARNGAAVRAVHAHAARHRDARTDGRRPRLSRDADRLRRHPRVSRTTPRAGARTATPSGVRSGSARPTRTSRRARLSSTIAQYYAATGKTADLSLEDLNRPEVQQFARGVESAVVHYGDITMTFLNNWFRNDVRGTSLTYVSAVAVEEKSVIDYNKGNPDGVLSPGEEPREPRVPLVAIYPEGRHALQRQPVHRPRTHRG